MSKLKSFFLSHWQRIGCALLSTVLPMFCVLAIFGFRGVILRGDSSLFSSPFIENLLSQIAAAKSMGGDLLSFGRVAFSGDLFILLAGVLPLSPMQSAIWAVMLCAALTSLAFYLSCKGFGLKDMPALAASVLYALSSYAFVAFLAEGASSLLTVLPLLILAEHWLICRGKTWPFALLLSLAFLLDARYAWICFVATVAWFFYDTYGLHEKEERQKTGGVLIRLGVSFVIALAVGLPTFIYGFTHLTFAPEITVNAGFDFLSVFAKMLPSIYDGIRYDSLPYICFGLLPILVLPLYFTSNSISKREKIASAVLLGGIFLTMISGVIGSAVDLFGYHALPVYAQTAIFGFAALFLSAKALSLEVTESHTPLFMAYGFLTFLLVIVQKMSMTYYTKENQATAQYPTDTSNIWITLFLATVLVFVIHASLKRNSKRTVCLVAAGLLATVCLEATFGQVKLLKSMQKEYSYISRHDLAKYYDVYSESLKALEEKTEKGYRQEKLHSLFAGENSFLGFTGVDVPRDGSDSALALLGGKITGDGVTYQSGIPALDALLSLKYFSLYHPYVEEEIEEKEDVPAKKKGTLEKIKEALFPEDTFAEPLDLDEKEVSRLYSLLLEEEQYSLWENPYALALLSSYKGNLKDLDFTFPTEEDLVKNEKGEYVLPEGMSADALCYSPLDRLNTVWSALSGKDVVLFKKLSAVNGASVLASAHNCQESSDSLGHAVFTANTGKKNPYVQFSATVQTDGEILMYLPALIGREAEIFVNSKSIGKIHEGNRAENGILSLGKVKKGTVMRVEIFFEVEKGYTDFYLLKDKEAESNWASSLFYVADEEAFLNMMNGASFGSFTVDKLTDNTLTGTFTPDAGETSVFTSLAYSDNTTVKVDGKKVDTYEVAGGLLGFDLPDDGEHSIRIDYGSPSSAPLYTALRVCAFAAILLLAVYEFVGKEKCLAVFRKCFPKKSA